MTRKRTEAPRNGVAAKVPVAVIRVVISGFAAIPGRSNRTRCPVRAVENGPVASAVRVRIRMDILRVRRHTDEADCRIHRRWRRGSVPAGFSFKEWSCRPSDCERHCW